MPFHLFDHSINMDVTELTRTLLNTTQTGVTLAAAGVVPSIGTREAVGTQGKELSSTR